MLAEQSAEHFSANLSRGRVEAQCRANAPLLCEFFKSPTTAKGLPLFEWTRQEVDLLFGKQVVPKWYSGFDILYRECSICLDL